MTQDTPQSNALLLATHVLAMATDAYLIGHPEWQEIVKDAREVVLESIEASQEVQRNNPPSSEAWQQASRNINNLAKYLK